ncbi:hypothetical protein CPB85DRAFT_794541 [Mucidula mucida]|nr:hypothetical protein CPB85DRAFT_794541 [Mucidula mucida]
MLSRLRTNDRNRLFGSRWCLLFVCKLAQTGCVEAFCFGAMTCDASNPADANCAASTQIENSPSVTELHIFRETTNCVSGTSKCRPIDVCVWEVDKKWGLLVIVPRFVGTRTAG